MGVAMSKRIDRRTFVRSALTAGAGVLLAPSAGWTAAQRARLATEGAFAQGVASGEPATNAITLWTRLEGLTSSGNVGIEVARDPGFARVVSRGTAVADAAADFTVHQRVSGAFLKPGEEYFYRFSTAAASSPVGRFRTARPAGSSETVRIAFFSCQEFIAGFYAAHRDLAAQDVDLVVCLGDYIYEQAFASTGSPNPPVREDDSAADGEAQTLAEYRRKYSLYHSDANLREVRRQFALVGEWDDHEVEDNYAGDLPGGAANSRRVPFAERRSNGYRAWFEHMPRRMTGGVGGDRIYGSLPLGNAELFLLDTRQYRDDQPCNPTDAALSAPCPPTTTDDPSRTLLGAEQKAWLKGALSASRARWKVIANQVMICSLDAPPHSPLNTDSWDGYGAERQELVDFIGSEAISDVTFVTGDIHTFFAGDVTRTGRQTVRGEDDTDPVNGPSRATEFVGGAVTSPGIVDRAASNEAQRVAAAAPADAAVLANNPHLTYSNQAYKGYCVLEAAAGQLGVRYQAVHEHRAADSGVFTLRRFRVDSGRPVVVDEGGPAPI
jgi:alkaline phosphatase D